MQSLLSYGQLQGDAKLRQHIARRMIGLGDPVSPDHIVVTNGCMEAITISLMAVTTPGDTIALESPTYFGYMQVLKELRLSIVEIPTHPEQGIDIDCFCQALAHHQIKACLLIPNFQNPQGSVMPNENKRRLVHIAARNGIYLIEDDIYSELYYGSCRPTPLKCYDSHGAVITCSSFSKTLCPGFRLGWVIADQKIMERIKKIKFSISMVTSSLDQHILCEFLDGNRYDRHLRSLRTRIKSQVVAINKAVKHSFPKGTRCLLPSGGFVLWVRLPKTSDSFDLYQKAMSRNIAILPGFLCSYSQQYKGYIRINCGFPFTKEIRQAIAQLGKIAGGKKNSKTP